jgi:hypothetical protein
MTWGKIGRASPGVKRRSAVGATDHLAKIGVTVTVCLSASPCDELHVHGLDGLHVVDASVMPGPTPTRRRS